MRNQNLATTNLKHRPYHAAGRRLPRFCRVFLIQTYFPGPKHHTSYKSVQSKSRTGKTSDRKANGIGYKLQEYVSRENFCIGENWEENTSTNNK